MLLSFEDISKKGVDGEYIAVCENGKEYSASYVNKYAPGGVMFFCIPSDVKILGYKEAKN